LRKRGADPAPITAALAARLHAALGDRTTLHLLLVVAAKV
jgi:hypothetical protein